MQEPKPLMDGLEVYLWALIQRFAKQKATALAAAGKDQYARFTASNNWLQRLMKRHAIVRRSLTGQ